jgi:hypothetical protein
MAFTFTSDVTLGSSRTGLSDLRAQPKTSAMVDTGSVIASGFVESGKGQYGWSGSVPNDTAFVLFYSNANASTVLDLRCVVDTNVVRVNQTNQTARDIGASVLLSSGTGTGQLSLSSGAVLLQATQTGVTIPTVTNLTNLPSIPANWLTGTGTDATAVTKIQAGLSTYAGGDTAGTTTLLDRLPSALTISSGNVYANVQATASALTFNLNGSIAGNISGDLTGTVGGVVGFNASLIDAAISSRMATFTYTAPLTAITTRSALGLASANLDTQLSGINSKTTNLPAAPASTGDVTSAQSAIIAAIGTPLTSAELDTFPIGDKLIPIASASYLDLPLWATGLSATATILKNGAANYSTPTTTALTEVGSSKDYRFNLSAADTDTGGSMLIRVTAGGRSRKFMAQVYAGDTTYRNSLEFKGKWAVVTTARDKTPVLLLQAGDKVWDGTSLPTYSGASINAYKRTMTQFGNIWLYDLTGLPPETYQGTALVDETTVTEDSEFIDAQSFVWDGSESTGETSTLTVTVTDSVTSDPVEGVSVRVKDNSSSYDVLKLTDSDGIARFSPPNGTYTVDAYSNGYIGSGSQFTVPTAPTTLSLSVTTIGPAEDTPTGTVTGYLRYNDDNDEPAADQVYYVQLITAPAGTDGKDFNYDPVAYTTSDGTAIYAATGETTPNGYFYALHRRGGVYRCYTLDDEGNPTAGVTYTATTDTDITSFGIEEGVGQGCQE